jgi:hypothetical protein
MHKTIKIVFSLFFILSSQAHATRVDLFSEPNGSLGPSINHQADGINVTISAHYYDRITNEVSSAVVVGIDGVANTKHPAGIGVGKSATSLNPPGIDNVGGEEINGVFHDYLEFLVFSFDTTVVVNEIETEGLGPHGTDVNYWGGLNSLENDFDLSALGSIYTADQTSPSFLPDAGLGVVSWFALAAKPEEAFNVFSIQSVQFTATPAPVPVPAAFWLFITGIVGLISRKKLVK